MSYSNLAKGASRVVRGVVSFLSTKKIVGYLGPIILSRINRLLLTCLLISFVILHPWASVLAEDQIPKMTAQTAIARSEFSPPYSLIGKSSTHLPSDPEGISSAQARTLIEKGGGIVRPEVEGNGKIELVVVAIGSPESEWSKERENYPDHSIPGYASVGESVTPFRSGKLNVTVDYVIKGKMGTGAGVWPSDLVFRSISDVLSAVTEEGFDAMINSALLSAFLKLKTIIQSIAKTSKAEVVTSVKIRTEGQNLSTRTVFEERSGDGYPSIPFLFDTGSADQIDISETRASKSFDIEVEPSKPLDVWVVLETTSEVWGWATATSNVEVTVERIIFSGEPLRPLPTLKNLNGVIYDETDDIRFLKRGDENLWKADTNGYNRSRFWVVNTARSESVGSFWRLNPTSKGIWEVFVFIPADPKATTRADYEVIHDSKTSHVVVNQLLHPGEWVSLGSYYFAAQGDEGVALSSSTGEKPGESIVQFDNIGLVWKNRIAEGPRICGSAALPLLGLILYTRKRRRSVCVQ